MLVALLASVILALAPAAHGGVGARIPIDPMESAAAAPSRAASSKAPAGPTLSTVANVRVNDPSLLPGLASDITPAIGVNGNQVLVVWFVRGVLDTQRLRAAWSEDGGATFTDAGWLPDFAGWRWGVDPNVDVDPFDGTFLISAQVSDPVLPATGIGIVTAHIAGGSLNWGPVSVTNATGYKGVLFGNSLSSTFDATNFTWHLAFDDFYTSRNALIHRYSPDHGATWFAPDTVVQDAAGMVGIAPRIGWMPDHGPMIVHHNVPAGAWFDRDALESSTFTWPGFPAPVGVATHRVDTGTLPGTWDASTNSAFAVDRTGHAYSGRAYLAWVESATLDWPGSDPDGAYEVEPNETPATATPVGSRGYLDGFLEVGSDVDFYSVSLAAGEHLVLTPFIIQSVGASTNIRTEIVAPDGTHTLGLTGFLPGDVNLGRSLFTAPRAGTYYVRITGFQVAGYTFAVGRSMELASPARDRRELMTSFTDDQGVSWSAPVAIPMGSPGFDIGNVALIVANDGLPYLFWQDYSKSNPDGAAATIEVTRSNDGGQTWETSRTISSVATDWSPVPVTTVSNMKMGYRMDAATTPIALLGAPNAAKPGYRLDGPLVPSDMVHVVWPDARGGIQSDIESAHFPTGFETVFATSDTNVRPGETVQLRMVLHNKNSLFPEQVTPMGLYLSRNWSHSSLAPFTIGESSTVVVYPFTVTVPDTAAPGGVLYLGGIQGPGGEFITGMSPSLHVQSTTAVKDEGPLALAFDPPAPNPVRQMAGLQFTLPSPSRVSLEVFDVTGARLRTLESGTVAAGRSARAWDLRDEHGRAVKPGVYLARLTVGAWSRTRRLVVTR